MKKSAKDLAVYERAIARYPHLSVVEDAKLFCRQLCRLAAVPSIKAREYWEIAAIANGMN